MNVDQRPNTTLGAQDHVQWIADEVEALLAVAEDDVDQATPSCPGWTVGTVLDHLARGAGMGWATWFRDDADIDGMAVLTNLPPATTGSAARTLFHQTMPDYVALLRSTPPDKDCFWFTGPVPAAFLFRLGAVEIATHRADVDLALDHTPELSDDRAHDAVHLSAEFLPQLWKRRSEPTPPPVQLLPAGGQPVTIGDGAPVATASGSSTDLWLTLWGRPAPKPIIKGDSNALDQWAQSAPTSPI